MKNLTSATCLNGHIFDGLKFGIGIQFIGALILDKQ